VAKGKDTRFDSNRKVAREAIGDKYVEIGVGFGDDPRVIKAIAEEKEMRGEVDMADIASKVSEEDENIYPDPTDDIDYESEIALRDLYY